MNIFSKFIFESGKFKLNLIFAEIFICLFAYMKAKLLNNIIDIEIKDFRYINFASYSNGSLIFETSSYPKSDLRIFCGFKENGRGLFMNKSTSQETYFYSTNIIQNYNLCQCKGNPGMFEKEIRLIKQKENNSEEKEYLISISKEISYVEIIDFEKDEVFQKCLNNFTNKSYITSFRHTSVSLSSNNSNQYYLFGFIYKISSSLNYSIQKHEFNSIKNFENENTNIFSIDIPYSNYETSMLSCFQMDNYIIMCFFLTEQSKYLIASYNFNLTPLYNSSFISRNNICNPFYKCIHLKEEIGIFAYYSNESFPELLFKEYNSSSNLISDYIIPKIILNKKADFLKSVLLNDIIKLNNNKICFSIVNSNKKILYFILINLFVYAKYKIRYYFIDINSYEYEIYEEIRMHNYNNFIAFGFSYMKSYKSSSLLIFSYPNSTDNILNLYDHLYNYSNENGIEINLKNEVRIENNLFGYVFKNIEIIKLVNCENLDLKSSKENIFIIPFYNLTENERIKVYIKINDSHSFNCRIEYRYKITEPNLSVYDSYTFELDGTNETDEYFEQEKEIYIGRLTYYNLSLNESLTVACNDLNCALCFASNLDFCVICKYNFSIIDNKKKNMF